MTVKSNWVTGDTFTAAAANAVAAAVNNTAPVFNVTAYGAVGNGSTVDTAAFQAAVADAVAAGGGVVFVPAGTYIVSGVYLASKVTLRGAGMGVSILKMDHSSADTLVVRVTQASSTNGSFIGLEDLTIDGDKATLGSANTSTRYGYYCGTSTGTVTDLWISRVEFKNCKTYACDVLAVTRVAITDCQSHDNGYGTGTANNCSGFECHANDVTLRGCASWNNARHGIFGGNATAYTRLRIIDCTATANTYSGFTIGDAMTDAVICGGNTHANTRYGVAVGPNAHRTVIDGVNVKDNYYPGIDIDRSNNCVITGCSVTNSNNGAGYDDDIKIEGTSTYTLITGNNIVGATAGGDKCIREHDTADYTTVIGNSISGTTITPVTLIGAHSKAAQLDAVVTNGVTARQSQTVVSGTAYYITGSNLSVPVSTLTTSTRFRWRVAMDKTAAGTGNFEIILYRGTNGTTADTADVSQVIGTQTAAVDNMIVDVEVAVTTTGATGAYYWSIVPNNKAVTATGFGVATGTGAYFSGTVSSVALNTASLKFGLGFKATTGTPTITIPLVEATVLN